MRRSLIQIENLTVGYRKRQGQTVNIIRDISLEIERGQTLGLVGESGCGKTTLCLALLGHISAGNNILSGNVWFDGLDIFALSQKELEEIRGKRIGLVPQNAVQSFNPAMKVGAHLVETLILHQKLPVQEAKAHAIELLDRVLLPNPEFFAGRYPHELSGGQQQRIAIAIALAGQPEVLILDEPTTGLDITTKVRIIDLLRNIQKEKRLTMIYVSHDFGEIARICEKIAVLYAGEIVEYASVRELFTRSTHPYTQTLLKSVPRPAITGIPQFITGSLPVLDEHFKGCSFAPRCPLADETCTTVSPLLKSGVRQSHLVRCHHWQRMSESELLKESEPVSYDVEHKTEPVIELANVKITYARSSLFRRLLQLSEPPAAVSDITLTVHRGETLALVGESGSGKTTLVRAIAGLKTVREGRLNFGDFDLRIEVDERPLELCRQIQIVFQNPDASLNPRHFVAKIIERPLKLYFNLTAQKRRERVEELLRQVRLDSKHLFRYPNQLSGGEKQRVAIARAFAAEPKVVLCDEVTSSLDVSIRETILDLLAELQTQQGVTYIIVSHDLVLVRAFADQVAVLYQGYLCETGSTIEVFAPPYHPYTEELLRASLELNKAPAEAKKNLSFFAGESLKSTLPVRGCPYQNRCARRIAPICENESPPWQSALGGHKIRCHIPIKELLENSDF
jgi:peptide/nickel transport system ATP-binding protein